MEGQWGTLRHPAPSPVESCCRLQAQNSLTEPREKEGLEERRPPEGRSPPAPQKQLREEDRNVPTSPATFASLARASQMQ